MNRPLRWLTNPKRLSDEDLVDATVQVLVQLRNRQWQDDPGARSWLEGALGAHLSEIEARIAQGRLFD